MYIGSRRNVPSLSNPTSTPSPPFNQRSAPRGDGALYEHAYSDTESVGDDVDSIRSQPIGSEAFDDAPYMDMTDPAPSGFMSLSEFRDPPVSEPPRHADVSERAQSRTRSFPVRKPNDTVRNGSGQQHKVVEDDASSDTDTDKNAAEETADEAEDDALLSGQTAWTGLVTVTVYALCAYIMVLCVLLQIIPDSVYPAEPNTVEQLSLQSAAQWMRQRQRHLT